MTYIFIGALFLYAVVLTVWVWQEKETRLRDLNFTFEAINNLRDELRKFKDNLSKPIDFRIACTVSKQFKEEIALLHEYLNVEKKVWDEIETSAIGEKKIVQKAKLIKRK